VAYPRRLGGRGRRRDRAHRGLIGDLTTESEVTNNPESEQAYQLMGSRVPFNPDEQVNELIVVRTDDPTVDDARFEQKVLNWRTRFAATRSSSTTSTRRMILRSSPRI
jgi:hypothetical protein